RLLVRHPHVEGGALKEIHYFDNRFYEGIEWYRRQFPPPRWMNGHKTITGEATPAYLFLPYIPERVKEAAPEVRLIALLRNPVNRAYSHYHHQVRLGDESRSFDEAVRAEEARLRDRHDIVPGFEYAAYSGRRLSSYLARGIYVDQLVRWTTLFDDDQLLVLKSEDFFERREETVKQVLRFLGLPEQTPQEGRVRNKGDYAPMEPATRRRLEEFFEPHNQRLYEYLGVDFNW
ncbi:MAG TPA: sulfotransferase domain-containing protein, partial [Rubrobacter sp.]|nr:sulfotransferase domain-containing protein [Rubrobacter sp.]